MQLTKFSDYSFRALIYLATNTEQLSTVEQMAQELNISQNHLKKIIHKLSKGKFIQSFKGRDGGIKLAQSPEKIILSNVLLYTEINIDIMECFKNNTSTLHKYHVHKPSCPYQSNCNLKVIAHRAREKFIQEFEKYNLADLL